MATTSTSTAGFVSPSIYTQHTGDTEPNALPGTMAFFNNPHQKGLFVYGQCQTSAIPKAFRLCSPTTNDAGLMKNHGASLGFAGAFSAQPWLVSTRKMAVGEYGWFLVQGATIVESAVASGTQAQGNGAGQIVAGAVGGKNLIGCQFGAIPTKTAVCKTAIGDGTVFCNELPDEAFVGTQVTGTGIPASTFISSVSSDGRAFTLGSAVGLFDRTATASSNGVTLTFTATGHSYLYMYTGINNPPTV